jgi:hypothetical protein
MRTMEPVNQLSEAKMDCLSSSSRVCSLASKQPKESVELALNIAWLIVAATLLLLCGARALSFTEKRRRITALIALTCLIWLLFPLISITDDLNAGTSVFEATTVKKPTLAADVVTALLPPVFIIATGSRTAWREINLHADLSQITQEFFSFDLSRRPPPQFA